MLPASEPTPGGPLLIYFPSAHYPMAHPCKQRSDLFPMFIFLYWLWVFFQDFPLCWHTLPESLIDKDLPYLSKHLLCQKIFLDFPIRVIHFPAIMYFLSQLSCIVWGLDACVWLSKWLVSESQTSFLSRFWMSPARGGSHTEEMLV